MPREGTRVGWWFSARALTGNYLYAAIRVGRDYGNVASWGMKTVAIIGASNNRKKFGNKAVRAFLRQGYTVFPVNSHEKEVEGLPVFRNVREVPVRPEKISVYLPPPVVGQVLPDIAARGCDELWLNPGTESEEVLQQAKELGLNVIQACSILGVGDTPD